MVLGVVGTTYLCRHRYRLVVCRNSMYVPGTYLPKEMHAPSLHETLPALLRLRGLGSQLPVPTHLYLFRGAAGIPSTLGTRHSERTTHHLHLVASFELVVCTYMPAERRTARL